MTDRFLIDTDVLVEYLRGDERARDFLCELSGRPLVSAVTVAELFAGARQVELSSIAELLDNTETIPVDYEVGKLAGRLWARFHDTHATGLPDAMIAATAQLAGAELVTFNIKHFPMVSTTVPYSRP